MILDEVFQQAYPWKWTQNSKDFVEAHFELDGGGEVILDIEHFKSSATWDLEFSRKGEGDVGDADKYGSGHTTGQGDAFRIFATVKEIIQAFVKEHNPNRIVFAGHESNRQKLYSRMLPKIAALVNMKAYDQGNKFVLVRKHNET